jgi:hypothetical protein
MTPHEHSTLAIILAVIVVVGVVIFLATQGPLP